MAFGRKKRLRSGVEKAPKEWERGQPIQKENAAFLEYYRLQEICSDEEDLRSMIRSYQTDLPAAFRVNCNVDLRESVLYAYTSRSQTESGMEGPTCLDWYPDGCAFSWEALARKAIRRDPNYLDIKEDLVNDAERGAIARQECVSMIPPLLMDMRQDSSCLDLCAAPGSKTSELLDLATVDALKSSRADALNLPLLPRAFVLSNDVNIQRARLLSHQLAKLGHPGSAVVCADATMYPKSDEVETLFDRVLADVPCSGDGTLRKNVDIWLKWTVKGGMQLHERQLQILQRGLTLVAPGGRLVYSTCSLNPMEDEAVVAAALKANAGRFRLVPAIPLQGSLKRSAGRAHWHVPNPMYFEKMDKETPMTLQSVADSDGSHSKLIKETMFASFYTDEILQQLSLASRFLPHENNSGGFFAAVFECLQTSEPSLKKKRTESSMADKMKIDGSEVFQLEMSSPAEPEIASVLDFYGLSEKQHDAAASGFLIPGTESLISDSNTSQIDPRTPLRDIVIDFPETFPLVRKEGTDRRIYLACPRLIQYVQKTKGIRFISIGTKAFEKLNEKFGVASGCAFRVSHEAIPWLLPYMRRRVIFGTYEVGARLLMDDLSRAELLNYEQIGLVHNLDSCRKKDDGGKRLIECGSCVFVASSAFEAEVVQDCQRLGLLRLPAMISGAGNISPLVKKQIREALLLKLGNKKRQDGQGET